jgi:hypothetical protein
MSNKKIRVAVDLTEDRAMALAQLTKRFGWHHAKELSSAFTQYDEGTELDVMLEAVFDLGKALAEKGYAPR